MFFYSSDIRALTDQGSQHPVVRYTAIPERAVVPSETFQQDNSCLHSQIQPAALQSASEHHSSTGSSRNLECHSEAPAAAPCDTSDDIEQPFKSWPVHRHEAHLHRISEEPGLNFLADVLCASSRPKSPADHQEEYTASSCHPLSATWSETSLNLEASALGQAAAAAHISSLLAGSRQSLPQHLHLNPDRAGHSEAAGTSRPKQPALAAATCMLNETSTSNSQLQQTDSPFAAARKANLPAALGHSPVQGRHSMHGMFQSCSVQDLQPACSEPATTTTMPVKPSSGDGRPPGLRYSSSGGNLKASMRPAALTTAGRSQSLTDSQAAIVQPRAEDSPTSNPQQGVPVYVMLPLDTVSSRIHQSAI